MDLKLTDKVAVILAASSGIGKGVAEVLSQEKCKIAICSRNFKTLQSTANEIKEKTGNSVFYQSVDVSKADDINTFFDQVFSEFGKVDILVTNAGGPPSGVVESFNDKDYLSAYELNLMSVIRACRCVLPKMRHQKFGRIITITSTSVKCALKNMVLSNVFRSAVAAFSKSVSIEYALDGIRAHCVMPGPFFTNRVSELGSAAAGRRGISFEQWKSEAIENTPLKRFGSPEEIGNLIAFLASEKSDYMNGTCVAIDGGLLTTIS